MRARLAKQILQDLKRKMVFLSGPRQVGKTYLSRSLTTHFQRPMYLNFDAPEDRAVIEARTWRRDTDLLILDEIHKMKNWKTFLKGLFDTKSQWLQILVTGSARLDTFRRGGDSLTGRFLPIRMLPLGWKELENEFPLVTMEDLLQRGGFPEPFLEESEIERKRWRNQYAETILRQEILDLERIGELKTLHYLVELLKKRVGAPISYRALSEDLSIAPNTVKRYIDILEALYFVFRITPFSRRMERAIAREPKLYFYDWSLASGDGPLVENFVAVHLLKHVYSSNDFLGTGLDLQYLRTKDGKELDFCLSQNQKILCAYEIKSSETEPSRHAVWYREKYGFPVVQMVRYARHETERKAVRIVPMETELRRLFL